MLYDVAAYTDLQPEFDGMTYGADQFMFQRSSGLATYRNNDFFGLVDGLNFALQYQGKTVMAKRPTTVATSLARTAKATVCP